MSAQHTNRLAKEKSPYLLQHAHNPVDWFAWNEEAFAKARTENKPIFLSIGYSTCHWCHVMERESFEDEKVGAFLNEHFVSIKVDREERPDVDKIYMTFVQSTTGSGGWPLNVFLTADLKPFFGGTYFPPDARHGRPSFLDLLKQIAGLWRERNLEIVASADELLARLELITTRDMKENLPLTSQTLQRAAQMFQEAYDPINGGFGGAPKFPQPSIPSFVLRAAKRFVDDAAVKMVLHTCERMAAGGIHDQLGGGFARYAVDAEWLVPHFEKMLYDNAQLVQLYLDAHLVSQSEIGNFKSQIYADTARDILDYVLRDMTHPGGGFYSAEDADSEGHEGKFYCWTHNELSKLLTTEEFIVAANYFGITKEGNFVDHSHPTPLAGQNILSVAVPLPMNRLPPERPLTLPSPPVGERVSSRRVRGEGEAWSDEQLLAFAKTKMLTARASRIRPHLDDKILASWNGLMLGAFARAAVVLGEEKYRVAAERNVAFIREKLWVHSGSTPALTPLKQGETPNIQHPASHIQKLPNAPALEVEYGMFDVRCSKVGRGENSPNSDSRFEPQNRTERRHFAGFTRAEVQSRQNAGAPVYGKGKANDGTLFHRWRDGERDDVQLLEGYAFLMDGVVHLYEATLAPEHLDFAIELAEAMIAKFYDAANGGFWQSPAGTNDLILRVKDDYDGAEPSGNSVATLALLKLAAITGRNDFLQPAEATLQLFAHRLQNQPAGLAFMLHALDFWLDEPRRVVVAGAQSAANGKSAACFAELLQAAHSAYQPNKIVLGNAGAVEPFAKTLVVKNEATAYVCTGTACQSPTSDPGQLVASLSRIYAVES